MLPRVTYMICIMLSWGSGSAEASEILSEYFPNGIRIGMPLQEFQTIRPDAQKSVIRLVSGVSRNTDSEENHELIEKIGFLTTYIYIVRHARLAGIIRSEPAHQKFNPEHMTSPVEVAASLKHEYKYVNKESIARADRRLWHHPVTAELWSKPDKKVSIYFISTSAETTLIAFNPDVLNNKVFFTSAEKIPELNKNAKPIREMTEKSPLDEQAGEKFIDRPWEVTSKSDPKSDVNLRWVIFLILSVITISAVLLYVIKRKFQSVRP